MIIISIVIILIIITLCIYFPKCKKELAKKKSLLKEIDSLNIEITKLNHVRQDIDKRNNLLISTISDLNTQLLVLKNSKHALEQQLKEQESMYEQLLQKQIDFISEKFDRASEKLSEEYQKAEQEASSEYLQILSDTSKQILEKQKHLSEVTTAVKKAEDKQKRIIELRKKLEAEKENLNFYKLQLSDFDLKEIGTLVNVSSYLRNPEILYKIIWKSYYEAPFLDLMGRILKTENNCGIYRITNIDNQKCYIGQSVDLKSRLRTHIKKGLGAEVASSNKLYTALKQFGVENFTYDIIEFCPREELNEKEKYWISYYQSYDYGYNETKGNN